MEGSKVKKYRCVTVKFENTLELLDCLSVWFLRMTREDNCMKFTSNLSEICTFWSELRNNQSDKVPGVETFEAP